MSGRSTSPACWLNSSPSTRSDGPEKKYSVRTVFGPAAFGSVHFAPGENLRVKIATSDSGCDAQDCGGGGGGRLP